MNSSELLRKMGQNFNLRPEPDSLGRRQATPLKIQEAMRNGSLPEQGIVYEIPRKPRNRRR